MTNIKIENEIYTIIGEEIESGKIDKGLWTKCFAEVNGEENKVKARYIKYRFEILLSEIKNEAEKIKAEQKNQIKRERELEKLKLQEAERKRNDADRAKWREEIARRDAELKKR